MNIPNFKIILQKLSILKNNSSILVAIIIAVVAIVLFIPTQLISSRLKRRIEDESLSKGRAVQNMNAISREQWEVEKQYQQSYASDANQIKLLAEQSSERELLSYKIFPKPTDESALIFEEFGDRFCKAVEKLLTGIHACDPPSEAELQQSMQSSSLRNRLRGGGRSSLMNPYPNDRSLMSPYPDGRSLRGGSLRIMSGIDATIVDEICLEKAKSGSVYANPADVSGYEFWREYQHPGREEAVKDCWYWQLGYWIIGDVIDTIEAMNADSKSVLTSPVKRLMRISFTLSEGGVMRARAFRMGQRAARKSSEDKPSYVLSAQDGLTESCTGRLCNEDIDVVHFDLDVLVSADSVLPFMEKLCSAKQHKFRGYSLGDGPEQTFEHNQISILESNIKPVDTQNDPSHYLYRYGEDPVMELELICEYIFNKTGYNEIKPKLVKDEMQGEEKK
jgi:hypothetical protein